MIYLDTSAVVKLLRREAESDALARFLADRRDGPLLSSALLLVETRRAVQRADLQLLDRADLLLTTIGQLAVSGAVLEAASRFPDPGLRSLDAVHLATALQLRPELKALVTYDIRLATAASDHRIPVATPGV